VINTQGTFPWAITWLDFIAAGLSMAWLAEVSCAEAEPECDLTAISAFELNSFLSMLLALTHTYSRFLSSACSTHKIFFFECFSVVLLSALSHSSEIWLVTVEAIIERHFVDSEPFKIIEIYIIRVFKSFSFV